MSVPPSNGAAELSGASAQSMEAGPVPPSLARFFEENLVCPGTGERISVSGNSIWTASGRGHRLENGIPCFVESAELTEHQKSELEFTAAFLGEIRRGANPKIPADQPTARPRNCWGWVEPWLNPQTVPPTTRIVCVGGSFADDLPHIHSDYKFNVDHLAHEYRKRCPDMAQANTHHIACAAETLPFADGYADVVYTRNSLDHLTNPLQALQEMHRILRDAGRLFVGVYLNSSFVSEHESTVVDAAFVQRCIQPLFDIEHRAEEPRPPQPNPAGAPTGFLYLVCRKRPGATLPLASRAIDAVGEILAHFHAGLYADRHDNAPDALRHYRQLLALDPVFQTDAWRMLYAALRICARTEPARLVAFRNAFQALNPDPFWLGLIDQARPAGASLEDDSIARSFGVELPGIVEESRVLEYIGRSGWEDPDKPLRPARVVESSMASPWTGLVFSKDRPLQLDAALRSFRLHCRDADKLRLQVLWYASGAEYQDLYHQLAREHPAVGFVRQQEFKSDVLGLLGQGALILFVVDDTLFVRDFALGEIWEVLQGDPTVLGFSLRLGRNTTSCYSLDQPQALPPFTAARPGVLKYPWPDAERDFGYPLEISSSVYRVRDVLPVIRELEFTNPNTLEGQLAHCADRFRAGLGSLCCFEQSVAFSAPVNRVQTVTENRAGEQSACTPDQLARYYAWGKRIEAGAYIGFTPNACHQEVPLHLTDFSPPAPVVSVVIPCFRQAQFLPEAVESVVAQTFLGWEIVIVNDGSPDNTGAVASDLIGRYPSRRIRLIEQANRGLAAARNAAIRAATGRYVLPLDADDRIAPAFLHKGLAWLEAHPETATVYTDMACFGASQHTVQMADYDFARLCGNNFLPYCALYRREAWERVGGYRTDMVLGYEDWDFWIACGERGLHAHRLPETLFRYRVKDASMITRALDHDLALRADIVLHHPGLYSEITQRWARALTSREPLAPEELHGLPHEILARTDRCEQWRKEAQRLAQDWHHHCILMHDLERHRDHLQRENDRLRSLVRGNPVLRLARAFRRLRGKRPPAKPEV